MQKRHSRKRIIFIDSLAYIGYMALAILLLQAMSLIIITILQYTIFNYIQTGSISDTGLISTATSYYAAPLNDIAPDQPDPLTIIGLWLLLAALLVFIFMYVGGNLSRIIHALLKRHKRHTLKYLFFVKFTIVGVSFVTILISAALIPAVNYLLPLNTLFAVACVAAFWLQHYLAGQFVTTSKTM